MDGVRGQDQEALLAELANSRARLDRLVSDLRSIDAELEELAPEREQHRLLGDVCGALERLSEIGGSGLFWGDSAAVGSGEHHLHRVRSRLEGFSKRIGEIDERRETVLEEIQRQQNETDAIEYDVFEAEEEEERLRQEWVIEREISELPARDVVMPWARNGEEDDRFRKSLRAMLLSSLIFAVVVPQIELPLLTQEEQVEVPERVVRLMMQRPLPPRPRQEPTLQPPEEKPQVAETAPERPAKPAAARRKMSSTRNSPKSTTTRRTRSRREPAAVAVSGT